MKFIGPLRQRGKSKSAWATISPKQEGQPNGLVENQLDLMLDRIAEAVADAAVSNCDDSDEAKVHAMAFMVVEVGARLGVRVAPAEFVKGLEVYLPSAEPAGVA